MADVSQNAPDHEYRGLRYRLEYRDVKRLRLYISHLDGSVSVVAPSGFDDKKVEKALEKDMGRIIKKIRDVTGKVPEITGGLDRQSVQLRSLGDFEYELYFKKTERMTMRIKQSTGMVMVSVPKGTTIKEVEAFVARHIKWAEKCLKEGGFATSAAHRLYATGEDYYVWGKKLTIQEITDPDMAESLMGKEAADLIRRGSGAVRQENGRLLLACPAVSTPALRREILEIWLSDALEAVLPAVFKGCETIVGKSCSEWKVRRMTSQWGSCRADIGRIVINLNLGHLPPEYLNYVVIHELTHLWVADHGPEFQRRMDTYLPGWRKIRHDLQQHGYMC